MTGCQNPDESGERPDWEASWEIMEFFDPVATVRGSDTAGILLCSTRIATFA